MMAAAAAVAAAVAAAAVAVAAAAAAAAKNLKGRCRDLFKIHVGSEEHHRKRLLTCSVVVNHRESPKSDMKRRDHL